MVDFSAILVCPVCRSFDNGNLFVSPLKTSPVGLACPSCNASFPVVDETPIVLPDVDTWLESELISVVARKDLPNHVFHRLLRADTPLRRDHLRMATYNGGGRSPLHDWLDETLVKIDLPAVDLGCGMANHSRSDILGVDLDWTMLQRYNGPKLVSDVLNPPFVAGQFKTVLLLNILDSCKQPFVLLQQADALLATGGRLILSCPFSYVDHVTPPSNQIGEDFVTHFLRQRGYALTVKESNWSLKPNDRTIVNHRCLTIDAKKSICE